MKYLSYIGGEVLGRGISVTLPPIVPSFDLPSSEDILTLSVDDSVKLIFEKKERMWVKITRVGTTYDENWEGILDNDPVLVDAKAGDKVRFHPLAVIDYIREKERVL